MSYSGLYVEVDSVIDPTLAQQAKLFEFVKKHQITTLTLYNIQKPEVLPKIGTPLTSANTKALADFIRKARTNYGVQKVAAIAENADFFKRVVSAYNHLRTDPKERFDIYNVEYEFWNLDPIFDDNDYCGSYLKPNHLPCDLNGSYQFFASQIPKIKTLAQTDGVVCETYIGNPITTPQMTTIHNTFDRILVHAYVTSPDKAYNYVKARLQALGTLGNTNVIIIFSGEADFMGNWVAANGMKAAENLFLDRFAKETAPWKSKINLLGFQWYSYKALRDSGIIT